MNIQNIKLYKFLCEQIFIRTVELYETAFNNKNKFIIDKKFDFNGNKTSWNDIEEYFYRQEKDDIEYVIQKVISYREPMIYGKKLEEDISYNLKCLKNIEDIEILDHLKIRLRQAKISNIIKRNQ